MYAYGADSHGSNIIRIIPKIIPTQDTKDSPPVQNTETKPHTTTN